MNTKWVQSTFLLCWACLVISIFPTAAQGPPLIENQSKAMSPQQLIRSWEKASRTERVKIEEALLENRSLSLTALRDAAMTGSSQEKLLAAGFLAEMRDKDSVEVLLVATGDPDQQVQVRAVTALRAIGDASVLPRLRELVRSTNGGALLKSSIAALGELGSSQDIPLIRLWLSHSDESIRVNTAAALAMLGSSEGQRILLDSTHSENPLPRLEAIVALGLLTSPEARARLQEIYHDPDGEWNSEALMSLMQQDLRSKASILEKVDFLGQLSQHRNRLLGRWAVAQLADLNSPEGTQILRELAQKSSELGRQARRLLKMRGEH